MLQIPSTCWINKLLWKQFTICVHHCLRCLSTYIHLFIDGETLLSQEGTTQGDSLIMVMYAIALKPLIHRLNQDSMTQIWFTHDATAGGKFNNLREWWNKLTSISPDFGYFPNAYKTCLTVKEGYKQEAASMYVWSEVVIAEEGKNYLGSAIGKRSFIESYVQLKVATWPGLLRWNNFPPYITQPHMAFAAFTPRLTGRWTYLSWTTPNIGDIFKPLEEAIRKVFLPNITCQKAFNDNEKDLLALPAHLG